MPGEMPPPYVLIKEVGQEDFEKSVNKLVASGYQPVGGVNVTGVVHPITGEKNIGFLQAMFHAPFSLS